MPVPWARTPTRIPHIENRGITIKQLRDLRLYLQRICKVGLLRSQGAYIQWSHINMYHIRDMVVKPLITFLEKSRGRNDEYSWVELVALAEQPPRVLISHYWGGAFQAFMSAIDCLVRSNGFRNDVALWVCTFAVCQFGEDFGQGVEDGPFFKVIQLSRGTALVVDRNAGSLGRIWCGLELHLTIREKKKLQIYTPSGRVGSNRVVSGPLVEALRTWDVTTCEATEDTDRRQILNYLVNAECEKDGLELNMNGEFALRDGWRKSLTSTKLVKETSRSRRNGSPEYQHEAKLFQIHADVFQELSQMVQDAVREATEHRMIFSQVPSDFASQDLHRKRSSWCEVPRLADRGVTLGQLRSFVKQVKAKIETSCDLSWDTLTCSTVMEDRLWERRAAHSYMEGVASVAQKPQYAIEHVSASTFGDTVASIEWIVEARQLSDSCILWWDVTACRDESERREQLSCGSMEGLLDDVEGVFFICTSNANIREPESTRWIHSLQVCIECAKEVDFGCSSGALACTSSFPGGGLEFGHFDPSISRALMGFDFQTCMAGNDEDARFLKKRYSYMGGWHNNFKNRIARIVAGPVLRDMALHDETDVSELQRICTLPGFVLNSSAKKGSLGETATHLAAASGNLLVLRMLLELGADANIQDNIRETPLHYAVLRGQVACAKALLMYSANASAESSLAETPLRLAEQNVTAYLDVNTESILYLLEAWSAADQTEQWKGTDQSKGRRSSCRNSLRAPSSRSVAPSSAFDDGSSEDSSVHVPSQEEVLKLFAPLLLENGSLYRKHQLAYARKAKIGEVVDTWTGDTYETSNVAQAGDMVVQAATSSKERYILTASKFRIAYERERNNTSIPVDLEAEGFQVYKPKMSIIAMQASNTEMRRFFPAGSFVAAWGQQQSVMVGDYLCGRLGSAGLLEEIYRIAKQSFEETYALENTAVNDNSSWHRIRSMASSSPEASFTTCISQPMEQTSRPPRLCALSASEVDTRMRLVTPDTKSESSGCCVFMRYILRDRLRNIFRT